MLSPSEFKTKAENLISNNVLDRLQPITRAIIEKDNFVCDVHCHFFDVKTVNIKYFLKRTIRQKLGLENANENLNYLNLGEEEYDIDALTNQEFDDEDQWKAFEDEIVFVENKKQQIAEDRGLESFSDAFKSSKILRLKNPKEVYDFYLENFSLNQYDAFGFDKKDLLVTVLPMDMETGWQVKLRKPLKKQMAELKEICKEVPMIPYFPAHPARTDLYEYFLEAFDPASSFFGVKIYPGLGYLPSDHRLYPIYEICEKKGIPVLTHCGGEAVTQNKKKINVFRKEEEVQVEGERIVQVSQQCNEPEEWSFVLADFPNLKLNLGHFGGVGAWEKIRDGKESERINDIEALMNKYPNVYADFSFNVIETSIFDAFKDALDKKPIFSERALYGSDFWVVCPNGNLKKAQETFFNKMGDHLDALVYRNIRNYLVG